jgi:Protein of unknown function with HXXEE motif
VPASVALASSRLARLLAWAPLVFVAHVAEESAGFRESGGFVAWFNAHVTPGITPGLFWAVNLTALGVTVALALLERAAPSGPSAAAVVAWASFLMLANALFHVAGALRDRAYMPGLVTAVALYVPYYVWILHVVRRERRLSPAALLAAAMLGAAPMVIHGYRIVMLGSRLF